MKYGHGGVNVNETVIAELERMPVLGENHTGVVALFNFLKNFDKAACVAVGN